jgi:ABC-type uncharacterized transport system permease subunit
MSKSNESKALIKDSFDVLTFAGGYVAARVGVPPTVAVGAALAFDLVRVLGQERQTSQVIEGTVLWLVAYAIGLTTVTVARES